jgi:hypothetical protein
MAAKLKEEGTLGSRPGAAFPYKKLSMEKDLRIKKTRPPDDWDKFFKQTKFRTPGPIQTLPKVDRYIQKNIFEGDGGAKVSAVGNGVGNAQVQIRLMSTVICNEREPVASNQFKPGE